MGDLYQVDMQYFQMWGLPDASTPLVWRFIKERTGSGALGDLGCHGLGLFSFVIGKEYFKSNKPCRYLCERTKVTRWKGMDFSNVDDYYNYLA